MREIEITASSVEKAIQEGLIELGATRDEVEIEIIAKGSVFKKAQIKMTLPDSVSSGATCSDAAPQDLTDENTAQCEETNVETQAETEESLDEDDSRIVEFVRNLLKVMNLDCDLKITTSHDKLFILIVGRDTNFAIGYRGETLDAIQYLALLASNRPSRFPKKLIIDAEGYREQRAEALTSLSKKLAQQAIRSGKAIELEPMNPFERRVIHTALQNNKEVTTLSEGEEPNRYVVICPVKDEPGYDSASKNNFKKNGIGKTRSFGQKTRRF